MKQKSAFGPLTATVTAAALLFWIGTGSAAPAVFHSNAPLVAASSTNLQLSASGAAPTAGDDSYTTATDQTLIVNPPGVLVNDSDPEGDPIQSVLTTGAANGSVTMITAGGFFYTPSSGFTGTDTFQYMATDGLGFSAAATVTVVVGGTAPPPVDPPPVDPPPVDPPPVGGIDGVALYAANCASCHGADGSGGFGPPVIGTSLTEAQIISVTNTGAGSMPGYVNTLSVAEIQAITDFLLGNPTGGGGTTVPPGGGTTIPPAPTGIAVPYATFRASCHGAEGLGTPAGPDIAGEGFDETFLTVRNGDGTMPAYPATLISDAVLTDLADYVAQLGSTPGDSSTTPIGNTVYSTFCASCHAPDGSGTPLGPDVVGESFSEIVDVVRTGDAPMPSYGVALISDADLEELATWLSGSGGGHDSDHDDDDHDSDHHDDDHDSDHDDDHHDDSGGHSAVTRDDSDHD